MVKPNAKAKAILDTIQYVALATTGEDAQPWNSPVAAFHFENDYTLYWASWRENQHFKNIRSNSKAFVVAYDSTPDHNRPPVGVYMLGQAFEITDAQEAIQAALVFKGSTFNTSDGAQYLNDYPRRIYKFIPEKIWMNDKGDVDGNFVDERQEAEQS